MQLAKFALVRTTSTEALILNLLFQLVNFQLKDQLWEAILVIMIRPLIGYNSTCYNFSTIRVTV